MNQMTTSHTVLSLSQSNASTGCWGKGFQHICKHDRSTERVFLVQKDHWVLCLPNPIGSVFLVGGRGKTFSAQISLQIPLTHSLWIQGRNRQKHTITRVLCPNTLKETSSPHQVRVYIKATGTRCISQEGQQLQAILFKFCLWLLITQYFYFKSLFPVAWWLITSNSPLVP